MMRYSAFSTPDMSAVWKSHGEFSTSTYVQLKPSVLQPTLHLLQEQTVTFFHGMDSAMSALSKNEHTQLMKYFEQNEPLESCCPRYFLP